ncbi:hypothetical protein D3C87_2091650 [compost metagenome]
MRDHKVGLAKPCPDDFFVPSTNRMARTIREMKVAAVAPRERVNISAINTAKNRMV